MNKGIINSKERYPILLDEMLKEKHITEKEYNLLKAFDKSDFEDWYCNYIDLGYDTIAEISGLSIMSCRGIVGSLVKKGYMDFRGHGSSDEGNLFNLSASLYGVHGDEEFEKALEVLGLK